MSMKKYKDIEYRDLNADELEILSKIFDVSGTQFIRMGPKGYIQTKHYLNYIDGIQNMELRKDDVFVATYQRSGTTLSQEMVWLIVNNLDYEAASKEYLLNRFPFIEFSSYFDEYRMKYVYKVNDCERVKEFAKKLTTPVAEVLATVPSPRFVKTHLPMSLLPPNLLDSVKVVYVARDPRDVVVSSHHQAKLMAFYQYHGSCKDMWNVFRNDLFVSNPYFEHVKEAWALRDHPNMLFLFYEDINKKMPETIRRVAEFFGKEMTQAQIDRLCDHLSIENFKKNESVNFEEIRQYGLLREDETFVRKGKSGGWRDYFDEEMRAQAQQWIEDNLRDTDLRFPGMHIQNGQGL